MYKPQRTQHISAEHQGGGVKKGKAGGPLAISDYSHYTRTYVHVHARARKVFDT